MIPTPKMICADSLEWMRTRGPMFDAVITDPPYGIAFMGKSWDRFETNHGYREWCREWMEAMLEIVRPGGHAAIFGSPKLFGHQAVALEDAGWELRDTLSWLYGQGFPKSKNLSGDGVMKRMLGSSGWENPCDCGDYRPKGEMYGAGAGTAETRCANCGKGAPLPSGKSGWGTALKPAWEPILLARRPLQGGVQANFDKFGVGALNIDASRVPLGDGEHEGMDKVRAARCTCENYEPRGAQIYAMDGDERSAVCRHCGKFQQLPTDDETGRWPANVVMDEEAADLLDESFEASAGATSGAHGVHPPRNPDRATNFLALRRGDRTVEERGDLIRMRTAAEGGSTAPSRFFYVSKASKSEREQGVGSAMKRRSDGRRVEADNPRLRTSPRRNHHPTVKPIDLGRWLTRMLVPPGGCVLDPFAGSGSFGIAAGLEGMVWTGIERDEEYVEIARSRIEHWLPQPQLL